MVYGESKKEQLLEAVLPCTETTIISIVTILISLLFFCKVIFNIRIMDKSVPVTAQTQDTKYCFPWWIYWLSS